jgi:hypothetical protein
MTYIQMCGCLIHCCAVIFLNEGSNCCNGLWCHYLVCLTRSRRVCYRSNAIHELLSPLGVVKHMHHHTELSFIDEFRWVLPLYYLKKRWCMLQAGPPSLHYFCAVMLHSCIILTHVGHSSKQEYRCCQLTRHLSCVPNFYRTFKVFIGLSLVNWSIFKKFNDVLFWHLFPCLPTLLFL